MTAYPLPAANAFPAPIPFPVSPASLDPYHGLNPYATPSALPQEGGTLEAQYAQLMSGVVGAPVQSAGLVSSLNQVAAKPTAAEDQAAAMAQVQTGIAKLATANPELAAKLQEQFASGGTSSGDSGGFFSGIMHLGGEVLGGVGKVLDIVGRTAHLVPALVEAQLTENNFNAFSTIGDVMTGKDKTNWNTVMQEAGWTGGGAQGVVRAGLGFLGDVATDPITWLFSPGAIVGQGEKAAGAALLTTTRSEGILGLAEKAGIVGTAAEKTEALTRIYTATWRGIKPGLAQSADAIAMGEEAMGKVLGVTVGSAQRELLSGMVEMAGTVYDSVATRTFKTWLRNGYDLPSGLHVEGSEVRKVLEAAVKAGAGQGSREARATWDFAKQASGALGGVRIKALVPWTDLRYISPALPYTDRITFGAIGRFASGQSGAKQLGALIAGKRTLEDGTVIGYDAMRSFMELPWHSSRGVTGFVETNPEIASLMESRFGGLSSMLYSASDQVGKITAAITPGAKQFRLGLGHYMYEAQLKETRAAGRHLMNDILYDIHGVDGQTGRRNLHQLAEDNLGLSMRANKNVATTEDKRLSSSWMDHFGGTGAPVDGSEQDLRRWFESNQDMWHLGRADPTDGVAVAEEAARKEAIWADMLEAHNWAKATGARASTLNAYAQTEAHGRGFLITHGVDVGHAGSNYEGAHLIHPDDLPANPTIKYLDPLDQTEHMDTDALGIGQHNVHSHDLGDQGSLRGVLLHDKDPGGGIPVLVDGNAHVLELDPNVAARQDSLAKLVTDQARYGQAVAAADDVSTSLVAPLAEQNPALLADGTWALENKAERTGNLVAADLKSQPDGFTAVSLGDGRTVLLSPKNAKVITTGADHLGERGFFHRTFTGPMKAFLKGETQTGRLTVQEAGAVELASRRAYRHLTLAEAETQIRRDLREKLAANGASAESLRKLDSLPIFERDVRLVHEAYADNLHQAFMAGTFGQIQGRMAGVAALSPMMYGRLAESAKVRYEIPPAFMKLLKGATKDQQRTLLHFMAKDARFADAMLKEQTDGADLVHAVVSAVEDGLDGGHLVVSSKIQRYIDSANRFDTLLKTERQTYTDATVRLTSEAETHAKTLEALRTLELNMGDARQLQEAQLQAQLAPLQEEARAIMARGGTLPPTAGEAARTVERVDYAVGEPRFVLAKDGGGWRVKDSKTGTLHSARIQDKARAEAQVSTMNERLRQLAAPKPLTAAELARADVAKLAEQATPPGGGFTIDVRTGRQPTEGFSVAISGHETPVDPGAGLAQAIEDFKVAHADELAQPGTHLGGWHDDIPDSPTFGKVVLDIAHIEPTQEAAEAFGRANGQTAIYDLAKGETIDIRQAADSVVPVSADMARLRALADEKQRIISEHEQRILTETMGTQAEMEQVKEVDALIDSKTVEQLAPGEIPSEPGPQFAPGNGLTPNQVERERIRFERAKADGTAEQLTPDIWVRRGTGPEPIDVYYKLGTNGEIVSGRWVSKDGRVIAESVRGLEHVDEIAPGRALGRAHWADQGIDSLEKAKEAIGKQTFSAEGARLNKLLVRDLLEGIKNEGRPTFEQVTEAMDNGALRVFKNPDGTVRILTADGALRQGGTRIRPIADITADLANAHTSLNELDQLAAGGEARFETLRTTRSARQLDALDGRLNILTRDAQRVGTKTEKLARAEQKRLTKASTELGRAYTEMNKAMSQLNGIGADLKPAMDFTSNVGNHGGMVRLNIRGIEGSWAHAYIAEEMNYMLGGKPIGTLSQAWRSHILGPWKRWATYRNPGFHVRNFFGAWFNNWLGGVDHIDYGFSTRVNMARDGHKFVTTPLTEQDWSRLGLSNVPGFGPLKGKLTYGDVADMLAEEGIGRANTTAIAFADDTGKALTSGGVYGTVKGRTSKVLRGYDKYARKAGSMTEDFHRVAAWSAGMRTTGGDLYGSRAYVMARHGDYDDLTAAEEHIKDIIPFYKWMRTNVPYQIRMLAENPGRLTIPLKLQRSIADAEGLDWEKYNAGKPQWLKETFSIPLPGGGSLLEDLPYSDLYMGFNDYLSRMLPVGGKFVESYGFKKNLFTGQDLVGKMVPLSGPLGQVANLPGFKQVLQAMPWFQAGADGNTYVPDTIENVLQVFPLYARFRNWTTGDPDRAPARLSTLSGWLTGSKVIPPDLTGQEKAFYYDVIQPALDVYTSMGFVLPTKDEMAKAASMTQIPPAFNFTAAYPEGTVAA